MRTTINLPDSLLARARKLVARRKTTLRALVEEGLRLVVDQEQSATPFKLRDARFKGPAGFAPGAGPEDVPGVLREVQLVTPTTR